MIALGTFAASDAGQILSADQVSTLPASNLFRRQVYDRWRTPAASGYALFDLVTPGFPVRAVWLGYTNATAAATIRVRASANFVTITSAPAFDTGVIAHRPGSRDWSGWGRTHCLLMFSASVPYRYWRIDVNQVSGASYYEAGRVYFGTPWRPSRGIDFGDAMQPFEASQRRRARSGAAHAFPGGRYRVGTFRLSGLPLAELQRTMGDLERSVRGTTPLLYLRDPENLTIGLPTVGGGVYLKTDADLMDNCAYGYLSEPPFPVNEGPDFYRANWSVEEVEHP